MMRPTATPSAQAKRGPLKASAPSSPRLGASSSPRSAMSSSPRLALPSSPRSVDDASPVDALAPETVWEIEPGGDRYCGSRNGKGQAHGHGKLRIRATGETYEGEFSKDKMHGHGKLVWPSGAWYDGAWDADERSGHGEYHFADGATYRGRFRKGLREAVRGTYTWASGEVYIGTFKNDRKEGMGCFHWPEPAGSLDLCTYKKGKPAGSGVRWSRDRQTAWTLLDGNITGPMELAAAEAQWQAWETSCREKEGEEAAADAKLAAQREAANAKVENAQLKALGRMASISSLSPRGGGTKSKGSLA